MISLTCGILKIQQTSEYSNNKKKQTHRYREQAIGYQFSRGQYSSGEVGGTNY